MTDEIHDRTACSAHFARKSRPSLSHVREARPGRSDPPIHLLLARVPAEGLGPGTPSAFVGRTSGIRPEAGCRRSDGLGVGSGTKRGHMSLPRQCITDRCRNAAIAGRSRCREHGGGGWAWSRPMGPGWGSIRAAHLKREPNCRWCGAPALTVDHRLARAFGGTDDERNLQSLCKPHADESHAAQVLR
jgi:5-methylcytosine-specific restriction protein A